MGCEFGQKSRTCLMSAIIVCMAYAVVGDAKSQGNSDPGLNNGDLDAILVHVLSPEVPFSLSALRGSAPDWSTYASQGDEYGYIQEIDLSPLPSTTDSKVRCGTLRGNPIDYSTGNKVEPEVDFVSSGAEMPLALTRTYNSRVGARDASIFGSAWTSNLDERVLYDHTEFIYVSRPGGGGKTFTHFGGDIYRDTNTHGPMAGYQAVDYVRKNADGTYTYHGADSGIEKYSAQGLITEIRNAQGVKWSFAYALGKLQSVTHSSGRSIQLNWVNGRLASVVDPAGNVYSYTYLTYTNGNYNTYYLQSATLPGSPSTTVTYHYLNYALLTGKSFNGQRYSYFEYSPESMATASYHAGNVERFTFAYQFDSDGWMTKVTETNPLGRQTVHDFDHGKEVTTSVNQATHCSGGVTSRSYDSLGMLTSTTDFNGNITKYTYSQYGLLLEKTEAFGTADARRNVNTWDIASNRLLRSTVVGLAQVDYTYGAKNRIASVSVTNLSSHGVANQVRTTAYSYTEHSNGLVASLVVDGPLTGTGDAMTYTFSSSGDLLTEQNSLGHTVAYSNHNGLGRAGRVVGANGDITDYIYDARNRVTKIRKIIAGVNADTDYAYGADGLLASRTDPDGTVTTFAYDAARRLISEKRNAAGALASGATFEEIRYAYDAGSNVTSVSTYADSALKSVSYIDYDEEGRVRARRGNNGQSVRYTYDTNGNLKTITDSANKVTTLSYDALDRVVASTDPASGITSYEYDAADRIKKVTDPRGLSTTYVYDGFGQLWAQHSPDTGMTTQQYNAAGQRTLVTRNDGSTLSYVYDSLGRLTWYGTSLEGRGFGYDWCTNGKGRVCSADYNGGTKHYVYTPQGLIQGTLDWTPATGGDYVAYSYDNMGRLAGMAYPNGDSVGYGYSAGKLVLVNAVTAGGVAHNVVNNIRYLPYGNAVSYNYGNGLTRNLYYDQNLNPGDLRLTGLTTMDGGTTLQSLLMGYNSNELITSITNFANQNLNQSYSYDTLSRLSGVTSPAGNETIQYDATGNRTMHNWLAPIANDVDPASNRVLRDYALNSTGINYTHDARGNRASQSWNGSTATYSYGAFNQLASVSRTAPTTYHNNAYSLMTYPAGTTTYTVNALDQRIAKSNSTTTARYVYTGQNQLVAENNNGQWTSHIWIGGEPVGFIRGGAMHWTHTDHLSRPELVTNAVKQVVWRARNFHSERGVTLDSVGGYNLGFPGQYFDAETGLWYNGFRYYDSRLGRYTQSDPVGLAAGVNTYAYVEGDPINAIDPLGLEGVGHWNSASTLRSWSHDPCVTAAFVDSSLNVTPGVGLIKSLVEDPNSLDVATGISVTTAAATEYGTRRADAASNARLRELQQWDRNRREQASLQRSIQANQGLNKGLRVLGRTFGILGLGVELKKFSQAASKCGCQQK